MDDKASENLATLRAKIAENMGRCILQIQQYEIGLKGFLSSLVIEGNVNTAKRYLDIRKASFSNKTLGQLVGDLTGQYLRPTQAHESEEDSPGEPLEDSDLPEFHFRFSSPMDDERHDAASKELAEMVAIRNDLVHHFIERFSLQNESGCNDALEYLDSVRKTVSRHYETLKQWDADRRDVLKRTLDFMDSEQYASFLKYGIVPGQPIIWSNTAAVHQLKNAEMELGKNGWTDLNSALALIKRQRPDLGPKVYQCSSWRHLLQTSGLFELRKVPQPNKTSSTSFRSR